VIVPGSGIIGFPIVCEARPRPVPVDIPIEIPRKDNPPPLAMPPARACGAETAGTGSLHGGTPAESSVAGRNVVLPPTGEPGSDAASTVAGASAAPRAATGASAP